MQEPLFDISLINPRIVLDIKYATADNFVGKPLYSRAKAYLRMSVAHKLDRVQQALERQGLGLKIWDAYRPLTVQYKLWELIPDERYVADPQKGSAHNRGAAVDVTLVNAHGHELTMPTEFDNFTERAHLDFMDLPFEARERRALLMDVMRAQGFEPLKTEWWHYNDSNAESFELSSTSFEELEVLQAP